MTTPIDSAISSTHNHHGNVAITIDHRRYELASPHQTGATLRQLAGIPLDHLLFLVQPGEDLVIGNETKVVLKDCARLHSQPPATYGHGEERHHEDQKVHISIDGTPYHVDPRQTGHSLKVLAGLPLDVVLFLQQPGEDLIITNEMTVHLKEGAHLCAQVPANYGLVSLMEGHQPAIRFTEHPQPDGWLFLVLHDVQLPAEFQPSVVKVLVKLPPLFPDAGPDMFWISPEVRLRDDSSPRSTSPESALDQTWQRFSWHLQPGAWRPGVSTFHDYLRCIRSRFERKD